MDSMPFAEAFRKSLPMPSSLDPALEEVLRHVLDHPGSLVRPRLVYQMALAYDLHTEAAKNLGISLEYFHTASLLFDDLPCMDNAEQRRGVPCAHLVYGQAGAILAALALINRAYALAWNAVAHSPAQLQKKALDYIEQNLGIAGLLNGQSLDLHYADLPQSHATTERIAKDKTVSLIRLTLVLPALLGGASPRDLQLLEHISLFWGLGYQITDDLKDLLQSPAESGKTNARDIALGRPNTAVELGSEKAILRLHRFIILGDRTLRILLRTRPELGFLHTLRSNLDKELMRLTQTLHDELRESA